MTDKTKKLLILRTHGRYMTGDIAGFDETIAAKMCAGDRPLAKPYTAKEAEKMAEVIAKVDDLDAREVALTAREAALARREAEIETEAAQDANGVAARQQGVAGAPPKQGTGK